jgi:hypothetical protein
MSNNVDFKFVIPFEKSEKEDGWYITGIAAGTSPDSTNDALTPQAIQALADQINMSPIPLRNHHQANDFASDIGEVCKATVTPNNELFIEARLDEDNADAQYLKRKLDKGKKFGLSIKGGSFRYYTDIEKGRRIRRHPNVFITEISVTTSPVWAPSLGTVLSKAIDGENPIDSAGVTMDKELTSGETVVESTESSAPENDTGAPVVSPSDELVKSLMANEEFVTLIKSTVTEAISTAQQAETATPVDDSTEISKSEEEVVTTAPDIAEIVKSAVSEVSADFAARLEALAERIPEVALPAMLTKSEEENVMDVISQLRNDPRQALRVGLAARHGELDKL